MAIHSGILAWGIPWTVSPQGRKEPDTTEQLSQGQERRKPFTSSQLPMHQAYWGLTYRARLTRT